MAEFQLTKCNLAAALINFQAGSLDEDGLIVIPGLNFGSATLGNDEVRVSDAIRLFANGTTGDTTKIARCCLIVQLASGALTVVGKTGTAALASFGSPTVTTGSIADTTEVDKWFDVTAEKPVITFQQTAGGAGAVIASAALLVLRKAPGLLQGHEPSVGFAGLKGDEGGFNILLS